ncbi:MAG: hypothetical protein HY903_11565 [Deltaproteobacteria bacterium]|nr:hypothetical protein [Deltaproteobacteria bacterium]
MTASACIDGSCNPGTGRCGYASPAGCCASGAECEDGDACTRNDCDPASGACSRDSISHCCLSDADCEDGDDCSYDSCTGDHRCAHQPAICETPGPCGSDTSCTYSGLWVRAGAGNRRGVEVSIGGRGVVLHLVLETEAIGGVFHGVSLILEGRADGGSYGKPRFRLYEDRDRDGSVDPGSAPLAVAEGLSGGRLDLQGTALTMAPASETSLVVEVEVAKGSVGETAGTVVEGRSLPPAWLVLLWTCPAAAVLALRVRRRRAALALVVVGWLVAGGCMARTAGVHPDELRLVFASNDGVQVSTAANERLVVTGAPQEGQPFRAWW